MLVVSKTSWIPIKTHPREKPARNLFFLAPIEKFNSVGKHWFSWFPTVLHSVIKTITQVDKSGSVDEVAQEETLYLQDLEPLPQDLLLV